jgi:hypothetical protein
MECIMRMVIGAFLLGHAIAHLPGFLVDLRLRSFPELPFRTTVLGGSADIGEFGIKILGLAWLMLAIALSVVAFATFARLSWWQPFAYVTIGLSIVLCLLGWPEARLGLLANFVLLMMIFLGTRAHWL